MQESFVNALSREVSKHISLSGARLETLGWLAFLVMQQGTICLWRLAAHVTSAARVDSVRRRFYRFFQFVRLDSAAVARVVVALLGLEGRPWRLALDRTNWKLGKAHINILMISVIWNGMGIPLIWTLLPSTGNSSTKARICLLDRLQKTFPALKIAALMGDREFIGDGWMAYLKRRNIPFILRLRENQHVVRAGFETMTIAHIARGLKRGERMIIKGWCRLGQTSDGTSPPARLVILRVKTGELLALACSGNPRRALADYRDRWTIESLFGNMKTRGFNLEDTHITNQTKLSTLLGVLALAVALAVKTGWAAAKLKPIPLKKHGRKAWSIFALGLNTLRKITAAANPHQIIPFLEKLFSPKMPDRLLKSMIICGRV